ncbi:MAG: DnaD domain protein [Selenomonadaceae bacterium]|nr:DnaD domain protein [Selenomonadaceae bacterium]
MAERRMFAKTIIDSDLFLDMPPSTQMLYFHLAMRADDDGFINNPKRIQRMVGATDDDMRILLAKQFILSFESGVIVIRHWKIHNYIRKDLYHPTEYQTERKRLVAANAHSPYELADDEDSAVNVTDTLQIRNETVTDTLQGRDDSVSLGKSKSRSKSKSKPRDRVSSKSSNSNSQYNTLTREENFGLTHELTDELKDIIDFYQENIELLTPFKVDVLEGYVNDYSAEWVQKAMHKVASLGTDKRNVKYLGGVLRGWKMDRVPRPWEHRKSESSDDGPGWQDMAADLLEDLEGDGREH